MSHKIPLGALLVVAATQLASAQSNPLKPFVDRAALRRAVPVPASALAPHPDGARAAQPAPAAAAARATPARWGNMIGFTTYDLQTNRSVGNRVAVTGNRVSTVWTQTCQSGTAPNFQQRGPGYNTSLDGGSTFLDSATHCAGPFGIASLRTGWPEIIHLNGGEVVFAHTGTSGIVRMSRPSVTAPWTSSALIPFTVSPSGAYKATWPRVVNSDSTVHMLSVWNDSSIPSLPQQPSGVINPVLYSRSPDGGITWDRQNINLPLFDSTSFASVGGDQYAIAARGPMVAVTAGSFGEKTMLARSSDGGTTFTTVRMTGGPFTAADTIDVDRRPGGDTAAVVVSDGSMSLAIDPAGTVHWFSGATLVQVALNRATGFFEPTSTYYPDAYRGLLYWNDRELLTSKPLVVAVTDSFVAPGATFTTLANGSRQSRQTYNIIGSISMPTATVDANGDVYCIFANGMRGTSNDGTDGGQYYRDLYLLKLAFPGNGNVLAYRPKSISRDLRGVANGSASHGEESVFPNAAREVVNGKIHYTWMSDDEPGTALQPVSGADPERENAIMYDTIGVTRTVFRNVARILSATGGSVVVTGLAAATPAGADLTAVPNPTTGLLTLRLQLPQATTATVVVRNLLGQEILRRPAAKLPAGPATLPLDLSTAAPGVYFCTVLTDGYSITRRVVKQ